MTAKRGPWREARRLAADIFEADAREAQAGHDGIIARAADGKATAADLRRAAMWAEHAEHFRHRAASLRREAEART